jgi:hypothetical protein
MIKYKSWLLKLHNILALPLEWKRHVKKLELNWKISCYFSNTCIYNFYITCYITKKCLWLLIIPIYNTSYWDINWLLEYTLCCTIHQKSRPNIDFFHKSGFFSPLSVLLSFFLIRLLPLIFSSTETESLETK